MPELNYRPPGPVLREFMRSDDFFRGVRGPVGSGKSSCCAIEMFRRALAQEPGADGIRKTRWAIIRNTFPELRTTTIKTWLEWFPEDLWGRVNWTPPYTHHIRRGDIDAEFIFLALDRPDDVKKLLSLELTGAWLNEARELPKSIVDAVTMRVGRYPSMRDGAGGATWYGVIADTNPPDDDHWWPIMAGETPVPEHMSAAEAATMVKPQGWRFWSQPPGMIEIKDEKGDVSGYRINPAAENLTNLKPGYYDQIVAGKGQAWIGVYVLNRLGALHDGKPVYPTFAEEHVAREPLPIIEGLPVYVGLDFGLTPSATFGQKFRNRWLVQRELVAIDMGATRFAQELRRFMASEFGGRQFIIGGDPAGDVRVQTDEDTPFKVLARAGIKARAAPTNDVALRIDAVETCLGRLVEGKPGFLVDQSCVNLIKGFQGGYHYKRMKVSGAERFETMPDKNRFSHVHDALQYMLCTAGEGRALLFGTQPRGQARAAVRINAFTKSGVARR